MLSSFSCHAKITQVNDMKEIFDHFNHTDTKTLVIFDVDMVLLQPSNPAFQMTNMKRFNSVAKRIMKEIPVEKQMMFLSLIAMRSPAVLIDNRTPQLLNQILQRGIPTIALTAHLTGPLGTVSKIEQYRIDELRQLGIDFYKTAPCQQTIVFDDLVAYRGNYPIYCHGVLFTNGNAVSKGKAFSSFLKRTNFSPNKVIFIDDREDNLKSLEMAIQRLDRSIEYQGLHFIGAMQYPSKIISENEFESQWQKLAYETKELN